MLFIILSLVVGILFIFFSKLLEDEWDCDCGSVITFIIGAILILCFCLSSIIAIIANIESTGIVEELAIRQETIEYKVNNLNKFIYNYEETINDINDWNEKIAGGQIKHESPWTSWFYPIDYSQFHTVKIPG